MICFKYTTNKIYPKKTFLAKMITKADIEKFCRETYKTSIRELFEIILKIVQKVVPNISRKYAYKAFILGLVKLMKTGLPESELRERFALKFELLMHECYQNYKKRPSIIYKFVENKKVGFLKYDGDKLVLDKYNNAKYIPATAKFVLIGFCSKKVLVKIVSNKIKIFNTTNSTFEELKNDIPDVEKSDYLIMGLDESCASEDCRNGVHYYYIDKKPTHEEFVKRNEVTIDKFRDKIINFVNSKPVSLMVILLQTMKDTMRYYLQGSQFCSDRKNADIFLVETKCLNIDDEQVYMQDHYIGINPLSHTKNIINEYTNKRYHTTIPIIVNAVLNKFKLSKSQKYRVEKECYKQIDDKIRSSESFLDHHSVEQNTKKDDSSNNESLSVEQAGKKVSSSENLAECKKMMKKVATFLFLLENGKKVSLFSILDDKFRLIKSKNHDYKNAMAFCSITCSAFYILRVTDMSAQVFYPKLLKFKEIDISSKDYEKQLTNEIILQKDYSGVGQDRYKSIRIYYNSEDPITQNDIMACSAIHDKEIEQQLKDPNVMMEYIRNDNLSNPSTKEMQDEYHRIEAVNYIINIVEKCGRSYLTITNGEVTFCKESVSAPADIAQEQPFWDTQ
jgi:hypothetical protein